MEDTLAKNPDMQHPGKRRKLWRGCIAFVRWVFIVLFAVILVGGLYFRAPWKILVLDAVLLGLLTVVPKKKRKYGWGIIGIAVLSVAVWIFLPERESGNWRPYVYDAEIRAINDEYGVPDDENAAVYYAQIKPTNFSDKPNAGPAVWDPNDATLHRPWTADEFPEMAAWLQTEQERIAPFWEAIQYEHCWFPITFGPDHFPKKLEHITPILKAAEVILRSLYLDLGNNDITAAVEKCDGLLRCATHFQQQSPLLNQFLGIAIFKRTSESIRQMVVYYPVDETALHTLEKSINLYKIDWEEFVNRFLEFDKAMHKYSASLIFEINDEGDTRYNLNMAETFSNDDYPFPKQNHTAIKKPSVFWENRERKMQRFCEWASKSVTPQDLFDYADEVYQQEYERIKSNDFSRRLPESLLEKLKYIRDPLRISILSLVMQIPSLEKRKRELAQLEARKNATLIMLALRGYFNVHGQWPERLAAIEADLPEGILSNPELEWEFMYYRPENYDAFVLYSYGGDDDSYQKTRDRPWVSSGVGLDDILIWPEELEAVPGIE